MLKEIYNIVNNCTRYKKIKWNKRKPCSMYNINSKVFKFTNILFCCLLNVVAADYVDDNW